MVKEDKDNITIKTEAMGEITISRDFLKRISSPEEETLNVKEDLKDVIWQREISFGFNESSGNTKVSQLSLSALVNRKIEQANEFSLKVDAYYSSSNEKMDAQKWYTMVRYAFSLGEGKKWYNFYKSESDHDRFANIDYRIIPSLGIGYWFSDEEDWKAMVELGAGFEHTDYRDNTDNSNEAVIIPRAFFEKRLFGESRIKEDISLYPSLEDVGDFRVHSETVFTNPIDENLSLSLSLINDYDSAPAGSTEKNDIRFTSSLVYSF